MAKLFGFTLFCLLLQQGYPRSVPEEESVVSVYTKEAAAPGLDVYHQIANNIAERITSPIYRFLGFNRTTAEPTTKKPWDKIEILETPEEARSLSPVNNDISEKDVEELSEDAIKKTDKKPEKITLYSNYLPLGKLEVGSSNDTKDDFDDFGFDDVESDDDLEPREGPFVFVLELLSSIIQLIYGGIVSIFQRKPSQTA